MTADIILQLDCKGQRRCELVSGLPLDETVRLLVAAEPAAAAATHADAVQLHAGLRRELLRMGGIVAPARCGGKYLGTGSCMADHSPRDHNVLVVAEDGAEDFDLATADHFRRFASHELIPVAAANGRTVPSPSLARHIMLRHPPGHVAAAVPAILERARLGADAFRIFISYRHDDCATAANEIFHKLAEQRFAVFLDRFTVAPGEDFTARIMSELFDKSCLLVLETPNLGQSPWVHAEVATARSYRLGLLAIDLPHSRGIHRIGWRLDCRSEGHGNPLGRMGNLSAACLDRIADFVRGHVAALGARRRRWLRHTLRQAIHASGVNDLGESVAGHRIEAGGHRYCVGLSPRPPRAATFKRMADVGAQSREWPVLFGPLVHQLPGDAAVTDWLAGVSRVRAFDEGDMLRTMMRARSRPI
ncbi:toll/interleukin-1 receptor domain-containing protein [Dongia sedimenti]|uniref:Toll/interleukin-1 receptor domain-containing protein n=1 Tax=Dongia sedimenti TaxID=3064282 RepID=A0ABU0YU79_9PROT|nr:toll/interleukin-1 receptor domain-containing protein [Rhodospirillaceae bacterium R-7]